MAKKQRSTSPSRKKYEEAHPVVSFRVSEADRGRFEVIRQKLGLSHGDVYKAGLGVNEVKIRSEAEIREKAYREGHRKGYELAESIYRFTFPCAGCGREIEVDDEVKKKAIREYMRRDGFGHAECVNRR